MFADPLRLVALACLFLLPQTVWAAELAVPEALPKFADFPAEVYRGRLAKPVLDHEWMRERPELYSAAMDERIMAAGHYVLAVTTGSSCQLPILINARTGKVLDLPSVSSWREVADDFNPVLTSAGSRLIILQGELNEEKPNGAHYFIVENGELKHLHTIDTDGDFSKSPAR